MHSIRTERMMMDMMCMCSMRMMMCAQKCGSPCFKSI